MADHVMNYTFNEIDDLLEKIDENYSKAQLDSLFASVVYDDTAVQTAINDIRIDISDLSDNKVDKVEGKQLTTIDFTEVLANKLLGIDSGAEVNVQSDWDETDTNSDAYILNKPTIPSTAAEVNALPDTTKYGSSINLSINNMTYVVTAQLKDQNGNNLGTAQTIDLPLESVVVNGSYNNTTKKVILTLQSGSTVEFSVADLVSGLQSELSANNKLVPSYIDYDSTHAAVTEAEKTAWNNKSNFSGSYNDLSDKPTIPDKLSDLADDSTHRTVTDNEKSTWNGKQTALTTTQLAAVNSGIDSEKVEQYDETITLEAEDRVALAEVVDSGIKNLLYYNNLPKTNNGVTFVENSDGIITISGTVTSGNATAAITCTDYFSLKAGTYIFTCEDAKAADTADAYVQKYQEGSPDPTTIARSYENNMFTLSETSMLRIRCRVWAGKESGQTFSPMICTAATYKISPTFVPYRPSLDELTARVEALEGGS